MKIIKVAWMTYPNVSERNHTGKFRVLLEFDDDQEFMNLIKGGKE